MRKIVVLLFVLVFSISSFSHAFTSEGTPEIPQDDAISKKTQEEVCEVVTWNEDYILFRWVDPPDADYFNVLFVLERYFPFEAKTITTEYDNWYILNGTVYLYHYRSFGGHAWRIPVGACQGFWYSGWSTFKEFTKIWVADFRYPNVIYLPLVRK
jgi:hypothetical protein